MDSFYTYVVIVAFVILLLALVGLGIMLQNQDKGESFPPIQNRCPDLWQSSTLGCYVNKANKQNVGDLNLDNLHAADYPYLVKTGGAKYTTGGIESDSSNYNVIFNPIALPCDKRKWANMHGIIWDGISNYNQC